MFRVRCDLKTNKVWAYRVPNDRKISEWQIWYPRHLIVSVVSAYSEDDAVTIGRNHYEQIRAGKMKILDADRKTYVVWVTILLHLVVCGDSILGCTTKKKIAIEYAAYFSSEIRNYNGELYYVVGSLRTKRMGVHRVPNNGFVDIRVKVIPELLERERPFMYETVNLPVARTWHMHYPEYFINKIVTEETNEKEEFEQICEGKLKILCLGRELLWNSNLEGWVNVHK